MSRASRFRTNLGSWGFQSPQVLPFPSFVAVPRPKGPSIRDSPPQYLENKQMTNTGLVQQERNTIPAYSTMDINKFPGYFWRRKAHERSETNILRSSHFRVLFDKRKSKVSIHLLSRLQSFLSLLLKQLAKKLFCHRGKCVILHAGATRIQFHDVCHVILRIGLLWQSISVFGHGHHGTKTGSYSNISQDVLSNSSIFKAWYPNYQIPVFARFSRTRRNPEITH